MIIAGVRCRPPAVTRSDGGTKDRGPASPTPADEGRPMMVTVPDVTGVTENDATFLLGEAHLDAATALDYCGTQPLAGLVCSSMPAAGAESTRRHRGHDLHSA